MPSPLLATVQPVPQGVLPGTLPCRWVTDEEAEAQSGPLSGMAATPTWIFGSINLVWATMQGSVSDTFQTV